MELNEAIAALENHPQRIGESPKYDEALRLVLAAARRAGELQIKLDATDQRIADAVRVERERWAAEAEKQAQRIEAQESPVATYTASQALRRLAADSASQALRTIAADMRANKETT